MPVSTRLQNEIRGEFTRLFGTGYQFSDETAPQGQNGYSTNFVVTDSHGSKYLLKTLCLSKIPSPVRPQVQTEIEVCKSVTSPYVVRLVDHAQTENFVFLIFPYVTGENLEQYAGSHPNIPESKIKDIGIGILRGIADIHRTSNGNIVHQDLKPENILITPEGQILLLDFGASRYKQSPFRGNARHNFAYSSPEQIRASRPSRAEELRITLSDKADVFSVGLILYRLIEGKHPHEGLDGMLPADAILEATPIPPFLRTDLSVGLKKIINRMLEHESLNRLNALEAVSALEQGDIQVASLEKGKLFYCAASSVGRFIKFKERNEELFDGLVIEATNLSLDRAEVAEMRTNVKTMIIDPQTYLFRYQDRLGTRALARFQSFPYYEQQTLFSSPVELLAKISAKDTAVLDFIKGVFQFQIDNGADALIAPFFYIPEFNDEYWSIDQEMAKLSVEVYNSLHVTKPLIKGISISEEILQSEGSRNRVLEYLQSLYDYRGYFALLDSSHRETILNESWLIGAKEFFTHLLATQNIVIWSRAELFGLALATLGLNIATGEFQKQRKFNLSEPPQTGGKRPKYYYLPAMYARVKWPDAMRALVTYAHHDEFRCSLECCTSIDFAHPTGREEEDLAYHSMVSLRAQFNRYVGRGGNRLLTEDIQKAKEHYESIRLDSSTLVTGVLKTDTKPGSGTFLTSWTNALGA